MRLHEHTYENFRAVQAVNVDGVFLSMKFEVGFTSWPCDFGR